MWDEETKRNEVICIVAYISLVYTNQCKVAFSNLGHWLWRITAHMCVHMVIKKHTHTSSEFPCCPAVPLALECAALVLSFSDDFSTPASGKRYWGRCTELMYNEIGIININNNNITRKKNMQVLQMANSKTQTFPNSTWPTGPEKKQSKDVIKHKHHKTVYSSANTPVGPRKKIVTTNDPHQQDGIEQVCIERRLVSPMASDVLPRTVNHVGNRQFGDWHRCCWLRQLR